MTYPHQHNCPHSDAGWCLDCVNKLGTEVIELEEGFAALEKWEKYFGFARLYKCVGGWFVSNKTDEGIGGSGPCIRAYGTTPKEALLAADEFLRDPKIPASIPCPSCREPIQVHAYTYNGRNRRTSIEFFCWNSLSCGVFMADDICPDCGGNLEMIENPDHNPREILRHWEVKCEKCGKVFPRGENVEIVYPEWVFEKLERLESKAPDFADDEDDDL